MNLSSPRQNLPNTSLMMTRFQSPFVEVNPPSNVTTNVIDQAIASKSIDDVVAN